MNKKIGCTIFAALVAFPMIANAQGVVRGAREGSEAGSDAAGPVGVVVGGVVGGVTGGVAGLLGADDRPRSGSTSYARAVRPTGTAASWPSAPNSPRRVRRTTTSRQSITCSGVIVIRSSTSGLSWCKDVASSRFSTNIL